MIDFDLVDLIVYNSFFFQSLNKNAIPPKNDDEIVWKTNLALAKTEATAAIRVHRSFNTLKQWRRERELQMSSLPPASDIEALREELRDSEKAGRNAVKALKKKKDDTAHEFMERLHGKVNRGKIGLGVAKFVRDTSFDTVLLLSAPGATGFGLVARGVGGGLLKGAAKWQDTGNIGAGMMQASLSLTTAMLPGGNRILVFIKDKTEFTGNTVIGLIEGKSLNDALSAAAMSLALGKYVKLAKSGTNVEKLVKSAVMNPANVDLSVIANVSMMNSYFALAKGSLSDGLKKQLSAPRKAQERFSKDAVRCVVKADWAVLGPHRSTPVRWVPQ